jgi:hypothetical protein
MAKKQGADIYFGAGCARTSNCRIERVERLPTPKIDPDIA